MEQLELVKYISPVAVIALFWTIIHSFKKRKNHLADLAYQEKLTTYRALHSIIKKIKYENSRLINLVTIIYTIRSKVNEELMSFRSTSYTPKKDPASPKYNNLAQKGNDELLERGYELINLPVRTTEEDQELSKITKSIFTKTKHLTTELDKLNQELDRNKSLIDKSKSLIDHVSLKQKEEFNLLSEQINSIRKKLQTLKYELTTVPLLAVKSKSDPDTAISKLAGEIQEVENILTLEKISASDFIHKIAKKKIYLIDNLASEIEEHIFNELK